MACLHNSKQYTCIFVSFFSIYCMCACKYIPYILYMHKCLYMYVIYVCVLMCVCVCASVNERLYTCISHT